MSHLVYKVPSHTRNVCSLYKRAVRNLECFHNFRDNFRYEAVLLRNRFDQNKDILDQRVAHKLLMDGEEELFWGTHYQPRYFANSPGGIEHGRVVVPRDWIVDMWHPEEKAEYPEYFNRREQRKKEYVKFFEENYANVPNIDIPKN